MIRSDHVHSNERSRTLFFMNWLFTSAYVTDREEVLVYKEDDLFAWLGGAFGLFVGYSMYDLSSQIIDFAFSLISRFTDPNI